MRPTVCGSVALFLLGVAGCGHATRPTAAEPAGPDVPVYREPMHRLVFQILDVRVPAGETTAFHVHANRLVGIAVEEARTWTQLRGAAPGQIEAAPVTPFVFDNWSQKPPYDHRVANVDTLPLHYVVAEWLKRSGKRNRRSPIDPTAT